LGDKPETATEGPVQIVSTCGKRQRVIIVENMK